MIIYVWNHVDLRKLNWTNLENQPFYQELFSDYFWRNIQNCNWAVIWSFLMNGKYLGRPEYIWQIPEEIDYAY